VTTPEDSLDLRPLLRAAHEANVALARRLGLGLSDVQALDHLLAGEPLGPGELGARLGLRPASATALADRLEQAGHVERRPHPDDRRRLVLVPTEHAQREAFAALAPLLRAFGAAAGELSPRDRQVVAGYLRAATEALRAFAAAEPPPAAGEDAAPRSRRAP